METVEKLAYSPMQAAGTLDLCVNTIYKMLRRGQLKGVRVERKILIPRSEVERFLTDCNKTK
jgi:excisionase family DNA binding protein